ncbi:MAG: hypothetical protein Q8781_00480 [Candidatus Phytoplasma stylosanthis]|uniref:hypothetical protein n=1 Tax=Candidatus Phytoplasma stylosanthis TaxID=2798314 RepID=UPI00293A3922|nr:hypothetical protein [Candidatus Phytoplasma stylosanthis]MDV3167970.1 hypothetical protein [Candidatus Phytoplasma stylosanthis]MDV3170771.1 hypothetical protein [Candidatus Phytoplasma stylosanthis]MDV3173760.1 hypothetical protein [Candidatus Phytoplasma stylosanthis]MDV3174283.1 hypothetical protein [Candidatus Phytoplasma stylosanthis]MDV3202740.1 hypothetical protein [Candidatus Phytoplasma stylosanthis]
MIFILILQKKLNNNQVYNLIKQIKLYLDCKDTDEIYLKKYFFTLLILKLTYKNKIIKDENIISCCNQEDLTVLTNDDYNRTFKSYKFSISLWNHDNSFEKLILFTKQHIDKNTVFIKIKENNLL